MWKIAFGFAVFAALALWIIVIGGDSLDMSGEKHDSHVAAPETAPAAAAVASGAASAAASTASSASK